MKRTLSLVLALIMVFSLLAGCQSNSSANNNNGTNTGDAPVSKPTELTFYCEPAGQNFPDGFNYTENWFIDTIEEMANVKITSMNVPEYVDAATKFNLMMASGEIPDIICSFQTKDMKRYGVEGAFLDLEPLIRANAGIMAYYKNDDNYIDAMRGEDGKLWTIQEKARVDDFDVIAIRLDQFEELGYTFDEIPLNDMDAIGDILGEWKEGHDGSVALASQPAGNWRASWMIRPFDTAFTGWMYDFKTGQVRNAWDCDGIVESVSWVHQLYADGILDPEFITTNSSDEQNMRHSRDVMWYFQNSGGQVGMVSGTLQLQPTAKVVPMAIPMDESTGMANYIQGMSLVGGFTWGISGKLKDQATIDACVRLIEAYCSPEVKSLSDYGREGHEYKMVDGMPTAIQPAQADSSWKTFYGMMHLNGIDAVTFNMLQAIDQYSQLPDADKAEYKKLVNDQMRNGVKNQKLNHNVYDPTTFLAPFEDKITNRVTECNEYMKTVYTRAVLGEITIDQFIAERDKIVKDYQDITDVYNEAIAPLIAKYPTLKFVVE